jgi:hypothetical protein
MSQSEILRNTLWRTLWNIDLMAMVHTYGEFDGMVMMKLMILGSLTSTSRMSRSFIPTVDVIRLYKGSSQRDSGRLLMRDA